MQPSKKTKTSKTSGAAAPSKSGQSSGQTAKPSGGTKNTKESF